MGRPFAYQYAGFIHNSRSYPVWQDDTDHEQFYVMPATTTLAEDQDGPQISVVVCGDEDPPVIEGVGQLVPYLDSSLMEALKKEYGPRVSVLPVTTAGQIQIVNTGATVKGIAVNKPWDATPESYSGMSAEQIAALEKARKAWEEDRIQKPLTSLMDSKGGIGIQIPTATGVNIGAAIPFGFVAVGKTYCNRLKGLMDAPGGGVISGQVVYHFVGTTRPWAMHVEADLGKVNSYLSQHFKAGYYWAKADIYKELQRLEEEHIINVTIWDENDQVTTKYQPEQKFDKILTFILEKAFNYYPNMLPKQDQAQADGNRWWWWHGSYARKESIVEVNSLFNIKLKIQGISAPMPVTMGLFLRVPGYGKCSEKVRLMARHFKARELIDTLSDDEIRLINFIK